MPDPLGGLAYTWPLYAGAVLAYLLGSIPFGLLLTRLAGLGDIREIGSGNIGATNVLRTGHKGLAVLTLMLDAGKGLVAVSVAAWFGPDLVVVAAAAVMVGHVFPPWLRFRGGKGVATALGVLLGLSWPVALASALTWLAVALVSRYSSLAAVVSAAASPFYLWAMLALQRDGTLPMDWPGLPQQVELLVAIAALVVLRHAGNIGRLLAGAEPRIGRKQ